MFIFIFRFLVTRIANSYLLIELGNQLFPCTSHKRPSWSFKIPSNNESPFNYLLWHTHRQTLWLLKSPDLLDHETGNYMRLDSCMKSLMNLHIHVFQTNEFTNAFININLIIFCDIQHTYIHTQIVAS